MEKLLPQNQEAEIGVLGSMIIDPSAIANIADILQSGDFYRIAHQSIYETIIYLYRNQSASDLITICNELARRGKLEEVGGPVYISSLINEIPSSINAEHYARIVQCTANCRRLIQVASDIAAMAYEQEDNPLDKAEKLLFALRNNQGNSGFHTMTETMNEYMEELEYLNKHRGEIMGVPTGFTDLDMTLGGLQRSDLILLGGRPGSGKTSLGLSIGYNAAFRGKSVAVFSLEMGRKQLARRMMSMGSQIDLQRLRSGWIEDNEWEKILEAHKSLSLLPIFINDTSGTPISSMRSQLRRLVQAQGVIDLVIVDYVGLIEPDDDAAKKINLVQQISAISKGLKNLAREFDLPVMALCQLSRDVEKRQNKRPQLADLRDSGSLEQDADIVMFVYRDDYYAAIEKRENYIPTNIAEVSVAKHRNGPVGEATLYFKGERTMFYDLEV